MLAVNALDHVRDSFVDFHSWSPNTLLSFSSWLFLSGLESLCLLCQHLKSYDVRTTNSLSSMPLSAECFLAISLRNLELQPRITPNSQTTAPVNKHPCDPTWELTLWA